MSDSQILLGLRLTAMLNAVHRPWGVDADPLTDLLSAGYDTELHQLSPTGVLAFVGEHVLSAWPDDEMRLAGRRAYRLLSQRLKDRGRTLHMVHPLNFRSVILTRKLGAKPVGTDKDGFVHYVLKSEDYPHHVPEE